MSGLCGAEAKEFVKLVDSLCGRRSRWEVWKDMTWLFATTISNAVDGRHREKREQQYMDIAKHYSNDELDTFAKLFAQLVVILEQKRGYCDFLGELFMMLELGNDAGGQFFTPYDVCKVMAKVSMPDVQATVKRDGYISVNDPACGAGATLIAAADIMLNEYNVNFQTRALFVGQDIDYTTGLMCYIQMSLTGMAGYVHIGNTLTEPMTGHALFGDGGENTWYTPMYFSGIWEGRRQCALMDRFLRSVAQQQPNEKQPEEQHPVMPETETIPVRQKPTQKPTQKAKAKNEQMTLWEICSEV